MASVHPSLYSSCLLIMGGGGRENYRQIANCLARVTTIQGVVRVQNTRAVTINDNLIMFILNPLHRANKVLFMLPVYRHANRDQAYKAKKPNKSQLFLLSVSVIVVSETK